MSGSKSATVGLYWPWPINEPRISCDYNNWFNYKIFFTVYIRCCTEKLLRTVGGISFSLFLCPWPIKTVVNKDPLLSALPIKHYFPDHSQIPTRECVGFFYPAKQSADHDHIIASRIRRTCLTPSPLTQTIFSHQGWVRNWGHPAPLIFIKRHHCPCPCCCPPCSICLV